MENREIKFRGKRIDNGEWVYGFYAEINTSLGVVISERNGSRHAVDRKTVGQYTGFQDKDKFEIYDNDIVEEVNETGKFIYEVIWHEDRWIIKMPKGKMEIGLATQFTELKIIGNKLDHPKLLK